MFCFKIEREILNLARSHK